MVRSQVQTKHTHPELYHACMVHTALQADGEVRRHLPSLSTPSQSMHAGAHTHGLLQLAVDKGSSRTPGIPSPGMLSAGGSAPTPGTPARRDMSAARAFAVSFRPPCSSGRVHTQRQY